MTDKVQKIRAEVEKLKSLIGNNSFLSDYEKGWNDGSKDICDNIMSFMDSLQKEPTTSVWHDTKEKPKEGSKIAFWDGYRMMGMDYADCRHLNNWLSHSEKWAYVEDLIKL